MARRATAMALLVAGAGRPGVLWPAAAEPRCCACGTPVMSSAGAAGGSPSRPCARAAARVAAAAGAAAWGRPPAAVHRPPACTAIGAPAEGAAPFQAPKADQVQTRAGIPGRRRARKGPEAMAVDPEARARSRPDLEKKSIVSYSGHNEK